jgi:hypothetical protein
MATATPVLASELSEEEFERRTLAAIHREFGPGGVVRFLMAFRSGKGDYTAERREWADKLTVDEIWRDMEAKGLIQK